MSRQVVDDRKLDISTVVRRRLQAKRRVRFHCSSVSAARELHSAHTNGAKLPHSNSAYFSREKNYFSMYTDWTIITKAASVCLSVCLFRGHTHRDSPGGSMRGGQRAFRPDNKEDIQLLLKAHHVRACIGQLLPHTQLLPSSQKLGFSLSSRILRTCDSVCRGLGSLIICIHCR